MKQLHWSNTVQLTLSIQHSSELMVLLQDDALPLIEHLDITNEEVRASFSLQHDKIISNIQLCDNHLHQSAAGIRLRVLIIRYIALNDLIMLIGSLNMSLLEKLILVDLYDYSKLSLDILSIHCLIF